MKIVVSGPAIASDAESRQITDSEVLRTMSGLEDDQEPCATHLDGPLGEIGIQGGNLRLVFDQSSERLRVVTEYLAPGKLNKSEVAGLVEYTKGQWSDGMGEGCFQSYYEKTGIAISVFPLPYDDESVQVQQINDGTSVPRRSLLLSAAKKGDIKKLDALLKKGDNIESKGQWGHTPLMCAVAAEQVEAAVFLISRGADIGYQAEYGTTCMQLASMQGNCPILGALIAAGANVNGRDGRGMTPMMWAANRGYQDILQMLLDNGADINAQDTDEQRTALMYAQPHELEIIKYLLRNGADPMIRSKEGHTASEDALDQTKGERELALAGFQNNPEWIASCEAKAKFLAPYERKSSTG